MFVYAFVGLTIRLPRLRSPCFALFALPFSVLRSLRLVPVTRLRSGSGHGLPSTQHVLHCHGCWLRFPVDSRFALITTHFGLLQLRSALILRFAHVFRCSYYYTRFRCYVTLPLVAFTDSFAFALCVYAFCTFAFGLLHVRLLFTHHARYAAPVTRLLRWFAFPVFILPRCWLITCYRCARTTVSFPVVTITGCVTCVRFTLRFVHAVCGWLVDYVYCGWITRWLRVLHTGSTVHVPVLRCSLCVCVAFAFDFFFFSVCVARPFVH